MGDLVKTLLKHTVSWEAHYLVACLSVAPQPREARTFPSWRVTLGLPGVDQAMERISPLFKLLDHVGIQQGYLKPANFYLEYREVMRTV